MSEYSDYQGKRVLVEFDDCCVHGSFVARLLRYEEGRMYFDNGVIFYDYSRVTLSLAGEINDSRTPYAE